MEINFSFTSFVKLWKTRQNEVRMYTKFDIFFRQNEGS